MFRHLNRLFMILILFLCGTCVHNEADASSIYVATETNNLPEAYAFAPRVSAEDYVASNSYFSIDKDGVLVRDYGKMYGGLGKWHNPLFIAVYANALYKDFIEARDENKIELFFRQVDWLVQNAFLKDDMAVWLYPFPNNTMSMEPGWISGLTQGVVLSVLLRAYALNGDTKYLDFASKVLTSFEVTVSSGGVATPTSVKGAFYEESAQKAKPSNKVLNGHIGALVGLYDYYVHTRDTRAFAAFCRGVEALRETIHSFDAGGTSYYSLNPLRLAPLGGYNRQHVAQLLWLSDVTGDPLFLQYALRFNAYERPNYKVVAVKGATNPETHGVSNLYLGYGQQGHTYWSHNEFPTWLELDLGAPKVVTAVTLFSGALDSAWPKDYDIEFSLDRYQWENKVEIRNNAKAYSYHSVPKVEARYIRITIYKDNGNNNVVLVGFGVNVLPEYRNPIAVVDWDHFIGSNNPIAVVDGDLKSVWTSRDGLGWIVVDLHTPRSLSSFTLYSGTESGSYIACDFVVSVSEDGREWQQIAHIFGNHEQVARIDLNDRVTKARYVKVEFKCFDRTVVREIIIGSEAQQGWLDLSQVFDALDYEVNEGRGYKDYLNPDGFPTGALLAWSESYLMQAYAEMFRATGDRRYLDKLYDHINSVICNRDDIRGQVDYKDELVPAWGTDRYTKDKAWMHFAAHTGMITYPMLEFVQLAREHSVDELYEEANEVLSRVRESIDYHNRDWVVQEPGFGLYTYPEDYYHKANYIIPLSQQATIGRSLVLLWKLTGDQSYYEKARDIALGIKTSLQETEWGGYVWGVQIGSVSDRNHIADISHSTITVDFIRLAYEHGIVFDDGDLRKLICTIKHLLLDGRAEQCIDGTGDYAYEITAGQYALLSPYDPEIWELCYSLLFELYRVDLTGRYFQEDWWGTVMLGIARLTHYVVEVPEHGSRKDG